MAKLLRFLERLHAAKIPFKLAHVRNDAIMVEVASPGERWEMEFFEDGSVEVERFKSDGKMHNERALDEFLANMAGEAAS